MRIVVLKGQSAYDVLRMMADECAAAFRRRGARVDVVDLQAGDVHAALAAAAEGPAPTLVYSLCIAGEYRDQAGRSVAQLFGAPHVLQHVDYPLTHAGRLAGTDPATAVLVVDESHVEAIRSVFGPDRFAYVGFCPHASLGEAAPDDADAGAFAAGRDIPILFPGTFYKPAAPPWAQADAQTRRLFDTALELALADPWTAPLDAFDRALAELGVDPADPELREARLNAQLINEEVRKHRRFTLLKAAAKGGLPLHIYGRGYEAQLYRFKSVTYGGEVGMAEMTALMRRSRVVLNDNGNFGRGGHDRFLAALLAGAAPATDHSRFWADRFGDGQGVALYRWSTLDADLRRIGELAADPATAFRIARTGKRLVEAEHGWDARTDIILAAAEAVRERLPQAA